VQDFKSFSEKLKEFIWWRIISKNLRFHLSLSGNTYTIYALISGTKKLFLNRYAVISSYSMSPNSVFEGFDSQSVESPPKLPKGFLIQRPTTGMITSTHFLLSESWVPCSCEAILIWVGICPITEGLSFAGPYFLPTWSERGSRSVWSDYFIKDLVQIIQDFIFITKLNWLQQINSLGKAIEKSFAREVNFAYWIWQESGLENFQIKTCIVMETGWDEREDRNDPRRSPINHPGWKIIVRPRPSLGIMEMTELMSQAYSKRSRRITLPDYYARYSSRSQWSLSISARISVNQLAWLRKFPLLSLSKTQFWRHRCWGEFGSWEIWQ